MQLLDPRDDGATTHANGVWHTERTDNKRARDVFEWLEENFVCGPVEDMNSILSDVSNGNGR